MNTQAKSYYKLFAALALAASGAQAQKAPVAQAKGSGAHTTTAPAAAAAGAEVNLERVCKISDRYVSHENGIGPNGLSYFISVNNGLVYYINNGNGPNNRIKEIHGDHAVYVPGSYDPVPTPDGKYLTTPMNGYAFYSMDQVRDALKKAKTEGKDQDLSDITPIMEDPQLEGVYQSSGIVPTTNGKTTYRLLSSTGTTGATYRDYETQPDGKLKPLGADAVETCKNLGPSWNVRTPMLSKDGRYMAFFDVTAGTSKIAELSGEGGDCKVVVDLGLGTGKVDFSPGNDDRITFHVDTYVDDSPSSAGADTQSNYFSGADGIAKDVFVMNLNKDASGRLAGVKTVGRLTGSDSKGYGTYYPRWNKDGKIVASRDDHQTFSLVELDPTKVDMTPYWNPRDPADLRKKEVQARYALGSLWNKLCGDNKNAPIHSLTKAAYIPLSLDPISCAALVNEYWKGELRNSIKDSLQRSSGLQFGVLAELNENDLKEACPKSAGTGAAASTSGDKHSFPITGEQIFQSRCVGCHADGFRDERGHKASFFDMTHMPLDLTIEAIRLVEEDANHVSASGARRLIMPPVPTGILNPENKTKLLEYLRQRKTEASQ